MRIASTIGTPTATPDLFGSELVQDSASGKVYYWSGSAWVWLRAVPAADGASGDVLGSAGAWESRVGTAFPTTGLYGGRQFVRTNIAGGSLFIYNATKTAWLSDAVYETSGGESATVNSNTYLRMAVNGSEQRYSAVRGWVFGFDVVCVGMTLFAGGSSTATVEVHDDGSAVTGASISLSAQTGPVTDETLLSGTIAAGSVVSLFCNTTGALNTVAIARARFKRIAT